MPSKHTFGIAPIRELLDEEVPKMIVHSIDPFAGELGHKYSTYCNDMNPEIMAGKHMNALDFLRTFPDEYAELVMFDPPYSVRQVAECYKQVGKTVTQETTQAKFYADIKAEIARVTKPGGKVISFGWNSGGIGKKLGFKQYRILLVAHGGVHNDTIVTCEVKEE